MESIAVMRYHAYFRTFRLPLLAHINVKRASFALISFSSLSWLKVAEENEVVI